MSERNKPRRSKLRNWILVDHAQTAQIAKTYQAAENWDEGQAKSSFPRSVARDLAHHHAYLEMKTSELVGRFDRIEASTDGHWSAGEPAIAEAAHLLNALYSFAQDTTGFQSLHAEMLVAE